MSRTGHPDETVEGMDLRIVELEAANARTQDQIRALYNFCKAVTLALVVLCGLVAAVAHLSGVAP